MMSSLSYADQNLWEANAGPSAAHWFGTDNTGRDMLSRVLYGARSTLVMGLAGVLLGLGLGALLSHFGLGGALASMISTLLMVA